MKNFKKKRDRFLKYIGVELAQDDDEDKNWKGIIIALLVILAIGGLVGLAIFIVSLKNAGAGMGEPFSLDDLLSDNYKVKPVVGGWLGDIFVYRSSKSGDVIQLNPLNNQSNVLFPDHMMKFLEKDNFQVSPDLQYILFSSKVEKTPNGQRHATYSLFNRSNGSRPSVIPFPRSKSGDWTGKKLSHASWSSTGNSLVFVYSNNLFFQMDPYTTPFKLTAVTADHGDDLIVAMPDFLYAEEILLKPVGHWLSTNKKTLAYILINQSHVPRHHIPNFQNSTQIYTSLPSFPYPKAGDSRQNINPTVQLRLAETSNPKINHLHLSPPPILRNKDHYITLVKWLNHKKLLVVWSNRLQTLSVFTVCSATSADCKTNLVQQQHNNNGWVFVNDVVVIKGGDYILALLPQSVGKSSSFHHVALLSTSTETDTHKQFLTYGMFDVTDLAGFYNATNELFYIATNGDPRTRHLFKLKLPADLKKITKPFKQKLHYTSYSSPSSSSPSSSSIKCLSCSSECKYVSARSSASGAFYFQTCQGPDVPSSVIKSVQMGAKKNNGNKGDEDDYEEEEEIEQAGITVEDNEKLRKLVALKALPDRHFFKFHAEDGTELLGQYFTAPSSSKDNFYQFPLLIYVDGTPGSQTVTYQFHLDFTTFMTSSEGVVVASFDGRGTAGKGVKNLHGVYKHLGTIDVEDLLHGIDHIKLHENINKDRMAIWGQTYGGFLVSHVMGLKGNHSVNCGIAVSPLTDLKLHDTAFTERYMGRPTSEDNYRGYDNANVLRKVKHFRGKDFLLVHGMADEKVHFQHSANLASRLTDEEVLFHQMFYPSSGHHLLDQSPTSFHLYASIMQFLRYECWSDKEHDPRMAGSVQKARS